MKTIKNCPICGASSFKNVLEAPYFRGDGELFKIQECDNCEFWLTSPRPEDADLGRYYETGEYISHSNKKEGLVDMAYHWVRNYSLKKKLDLINKLVGKPGMLLDYGAGTGHFVNTAHQAKWKVDGVEPSKEARSVAQKDNNLQLKSPQSFQWPGEYYDVISLWHVLEHLPDLNGHLENFYRALKPGGYLVVAVPNHESYDSKCYGSNWAALDVPLHLWHFKKKNMEELGRKHQLPLQGIINMPFDSFYVSMLSEKIESGKANYARAVKRGLLSNMKGKSDKNMSSLIYVLQKPA